MALPIQSIIETRRHQMFPVLEAQEIERVRRFGHVRSYAAGEALAKVGDMGHGLTIILAGQVDITQHDQSGRRTPIVTYGPGSFMGELAQLAGQRTLVDAYAQGTVEALKVPPERLRALLIAEAELGERIMRALILRRMGLLETGAGGPVIVGRAGNGDVLRLGARDAAAILLAYRHGLRASELCSLRWSQIDLRNGRLHVNRAKGGIESVHPLHGPELRALRPLQSSGAYVFVTEAGTPVTTAWFLRMIQRTGRAAKLPFPVHPHMLRHSTGYKLANQGEDTRSLAHYLGHRNLQSTARYTALAPDRFKGFWKD